MKRVSELVFAGPATPEQLTEFKEIFLKSAFDSSALQPNDDWITFTNQNEQYQLTISPHKDLQHTWYARRIDPLYVRYTNLAEYNKQAEKMFAEEFFYGIKDSDGLHSLVNQVKQGGFGALTISIRAFCVWPRITGTQSPLSKCSTTAISGQPLSLPLLF